MTVPADEAMCHCGRPLHYASEESYLMVKRLVDRLGPNVDVVAGGRTWSVQRHYIALHGLRADELPTLGFPEVEEPRRG